MAGLDWREIEKFPWSIPLGSILKIPIRLHITFFILLLAQTLGAIFYGGWYVLLWFILMGPFLLITILVHELGHCLATRSIGGTVDRILLWPLGGIAFISYNTTYLKSIWVSIAGPLTHIPMVAIWVVLLLPAYHAANGSWHITLALPYPDAAHFGQALCAYAIILNISLFVFNLAVPAYPLDGGRILTMCLLMAGVSMRTTAIVTMTLATAISVGLVVYGIVQFQMVTILVAVFILFATFQLFQAFRGGKLAEHPLFATVSAEGGPTGPSGSGASGQKPAGNQLGVAGPGGSFPQPGMYVPPVYPAPGYPPAGQPATGQSPPGYPAGMYSGSPYSYNAGQAV